MRLSLALALSLVAVAACGGDDGETYPPCRPGPAEDVRCENTCGNGQIDTCWWHRPTGCGTWEPRVEECDGEAGVTCEQLGYYGGDVACTYDCRANDSGCSSCAPGVPCVSLAGAISHKGAAISGSRIALIGERSITFQEDLTQVGSLTFDGTIGSVVGVPDGWLVAHDGPPRIAVTSLVGEVTRVQTLALDAVPALEYGPGGRVLLAWSEFAGPNDFRVRFAIANADATSAVPGGELLAAPQGAFATETDGTRFFVGASGRLATIAADGTTAVTTGFPAPMDSSTTAVVHLAFGGTTGWYIASTGTPRYTAQRFDANGALVGAAIPLDVDHYISDVVAEGDDVLLLHFVGDGPPLEPGKLVVERMSPEGTSGTPTEIGAGIASARMLARAGELVVTWQTRSSGVLAFVTPP